jgi:hypothetical protein
VQADIGGAQKLAAAAKKGAEKAPLVLRQQHRGTSYTRIRPQLVTG